MASSSAVVMSRSIQHLLRRHAAATSALSSVVGKSLIGQPLPLNPTPEDPISAGAATNAGFPIPSLDLGLFGRFDWPAMAVKKSDDEEYTKDDDSDDFSGDDFDSDELDDDEDDEDVDDEDVPEAMSLRNKSS